MMAIHSRDTERDSRLSVIPGVRDWVAPNDMVHFVIHAMKLINLPQLTVTYRGAGELKNHPRMLLALLFYCYVNDIMSSKSVHEATWNVLQLRYLTEDTRPDYDAIRAFREEHTEAIHDVFRQFFDIARKAGYVKVGTVRLVASECIYTTMHPTIRGIRVQAKACKNIHYDRDRELERQLDRDVSHLLGKAAEADEAGREEKEIRDSIRRVDRWIRSSEFQINLP
jgi:transposase